MRTLIQRVTRASVIIEETLHSSIDSGLLILLGIEEQDTVEDINWLTHKIVNLRIFSDETGKMNLSLIDIAGEALVVSQFTLHAGTKKGTRPSFIKAAKPDIAIPLYEQFIKVLNEKIQKEIKSGVFGADMQVSLVNDGPVTLWIDSKNKE